MELFTNLLTSRQICLFLEYKLHAKNIKIKKFDDIDSMDWIFFTYDNYNYKVIHHLKSKRISFTGSLMSVGLENPIPNIEDKRKDLENLLENFLNFFGGVVLIGDEVVLSQDKNSDLEDSEFIIERLHLLGADLSLINNILESELNKVEKNKKGH